MYIIKGGRGTGKTYKLLEAANANKGIVISSNPLSLREKARAWGFTEITDFIGPRDSVDYSFQENLYIDDIEKYITEVMASGRQLAGYTYTFEE